MRWGFIRPPGSKRIRAEGDRRIEAMLDELQQPRSATEPDVGAVLRDLLAALEDDRAWALDDGQTERALGLTDAIERVRSLAARHPRRHTADETENQT